MTAEELLAARLEQQKIDHEEPLVEYDTDDEDEDDDIDDDDDDTVLQRIQQLIQKEEHKVLIEWLHESEQRIAGDADDDVELQRQRHRLLIQWLDGSEQQIAEDADDKDDDDDVELQQQKNGVLIRWLDESEQQIAGDADHKDDDDVEVELQQKQKSMQHIIQVQQQFIQRKWRRGVLFQWLVESDQRIMRDKGIDLPPPPEHDRDNVIVGLQQQQFIQQQHQFIQQRMQKFMQQQQRFIQQQQQWEGALLWWLVESKQRIARHAGIELPPAPQIQILRPRL